MGNLAFTIDTSQEIPLSTNQDLFRWMDYASMVAMFFNAFGVWVIGFHTPNTMRSYGIALTAYQGIGFGVAAHMASLLMIMFMLRHQAIMPPNHLLKFDHKLMLGVYIGLQIFAYIHLITMASYVFYNDDVEATKQLYLKRYFMFRQFLEVPRCYVFTPKDGVLMMINISAWVVVLFFIVMGCVKPRTFVISETSTIAVTKENRRANKLRLAAANARFLSSTPVSTTMNDLG
ncbi:unnamed protein product, partial [Mesorhabditis spiculigera]